MTSDAAGSHPAKLGHYELQDRLGAGGMGVVYRARDERYGNTVALKVIHPHLQNAPGYIERFRREAHIASMLTSPFVVKTLEFGQDQGQYFLASEFVEGEALAARIKREPLSDEQATRIITEVAMALDSAHGRGIIHRDLKPENIMIARDGSARLMDFGLSHLAYVQGVTATGFYSGSAAYSAPEQFESQGDARSDLYSAGAVLFEMLAGRAPFDSPSLAGMMRQHQSEPPPFDLIANRAEGLKAVVARCMAKDPAWRYQHASEMLQALQGAATRRTVAPPDDAQTVVDRRASDPPTQISPSQPSDAAGTVMTPRAPSQPPPPTSPPVEYAAPAPLPSSPRKSNTGILVAVGAVVAIAAGALFLMSSSGGDDDNSGAFGKAAVASPTIAAQSTTAPAATATPSGRAAAQPTTRPPATTAPTTRPATPSLNIVRVTPTAAQRYPADLQKEFMDDCTGANASQTVCRCMLDILQVRYDVTGYREFERAVNRNERQDEINAVARACV